MSIFKKRGLTAKMTTNRPMSPKRVYREAREIIHEETDSGKSIIRFMLEAMKGTIHNITPAAQVEAAKWLGAYAFGKPLEQSVQITMNAGEQLPGISDEDLEKLLREGTDALLEAQTVEALPSGEDAVEEALIEEKEDDPTSN